MKSTLQHFKRKREKMPRNKYPEETRQKIMETALELFLNKGYDETTVLDIIANLGGLTRGAFYHHFKSKDDVLDALFARFGVGMLPMEQAREAKVSSGLERIRLLLKLSLQSNTANKEITKLTGMVLELMQKPRFFYERHLEMLEHISDIEPMVAEGMADGSIRKGNPRAYAEILMLLMNLWMIPHVFPPASPQDLMDKGEIMYEMLEAIGLPVLDSEIDELYVKTLKAIEKE